MPIKYYCKISDEFFLNKNDAVKHINSQFHKKGVIRTVLNKEKNNPPEFYKMRDMFLSTEVSHERDLLYYQLKRIDTGNREEKVIYLCPHCSREYIRPNTLIKHIENTCKVVKDNSYQMTEDEEDEEEQYRIERKEYIQKLCDRLKIDNILDEDNPNYKETNIEDEECPEIDIIEDEDQDFVDFKNLINYAASQGLSPDEQFAYVYHIQKKKREELFGKIKYYYMMIKREEDKKMIYETQKICLKCVNECNRVLKQVTNKVGDLSLLNNGILRVTDEDVVNQSTIINKKYDDIDTMCQIETPMTNTVNDSDINNIETLTTEELKLKVRKILKNNTNNNEEDIYCEIDGLFRENAGVFNSYLKDNHIKFEHLFQQ